MITDQLLRVSNAQNVTVTAVSVDSVDLSQARDIGEGQDLFMNFAVGTAFAGGTSTEFQVIVADNGALTTNVTVIGSSGAIPTASLTAGSMQAVRLNPMIASLGRRFLGARYVVAGTNTAGNVTSDIVLDIQDGRKSYASGFTVA
jgi:hypothetical protein